MQPKHNKTHKTKERKNAVWQIKHAHGLKHMTPKRETSVCPTKEKKMLEKGPKNKAENSVHFPLHISLFPGTTFEIRVLRCVRRKVGVFV